MTGGTPSTKDPRNYEGGTIPWIASGDIHQSRLRQASKLITQHGMETSPAKFLPRGSVLIALNGQGRTRGTVAMLDIERATCNQSVISMNPKDSARLDSEYLFVTLRSMYSELRNRTGDKNRAGLNIRILRGFQIPLPPLAEQKRIAGILDAADALRAKRRESIEQLDRLIQSVFLEMFGDPKKHEWAFTTVENLAVGKKGSIRTGPFGSQLLHSEFVDSGIRVLGIDNAVQNLFVEGEPRYITADKYKQLTRYTVRPGDVLITIMGTCGRCAIVPDDIGTAINTKHLCCISLDREKCNPQFLHACFLLHPVARRYLEQSAKGAIMTGLNMGVIKSLPVPLAPIALQREYAAISSAIKSNQDQNIAHLAELENMFASLQSQAFSGAL